MKSVTFCPEEGLISNAEFLQKIISSPLATITNNKKEVYYNVPAAFDIETSSFYATTSEGKKQKQACMYVWQFGILNWVTYGRTWNEFKAFMSLLSSALRLDETRRIIIYVHNLPYEFAFMRTQVRFDKVFLLEERKPVYALWGGFEFRCSLKLASKSLEKVGEDLLKYPVKKQVGDLDYELTRFHSTPLTAKELGYCEGDIRVLLAYIQEKIEVDNGITNIPLTNTGYVRNRCRKACFKRSSYQSYKKLMSELTLDPEEYQALKRAFSGGFTHASAKYVAKILSMVASFDFTSSYPAVMLLEKFPMSKAHIENSLTPEKFKWFIDNKCCLFDITLYNVTAKVDYDHPISVSKVIFPADRELKKKIRNNMRIDNGRIVYAEKITLTMTEQDWFIFKNFYDYGYEDEPDKKSYEIHSFRWYDKGYLPKELYMAILGLYKEKTELKDVEGKEIDYMILKNMLNAAYGMIVTDIVRDILDYDPDFGYQKARKPDLAEAIEKYNTSKKRFLFYPWGVWVTAYARRNLFSGILACKGDYIYSDTDSIKILNYKDHLDYINSYNALIKKKIEIAAARFKISPDLYSPLNKKGKAKTIGVWDFEGVYKKFKTLGAKRYMFERLPEDIDDSKGRRRYSLTVAGVNKSKACDYLVKTYKPNPFKGFTKDLRVPKEYSGRLILTYFDEPCSGRGIDYLGNECDYSENSYVHMEASNYNLTISQEFKSYLQFCYGITEDSW